MRNRYPTRRLLLCLVLAQALAVQALLLAWSGAQAAAGPASVLFGVICSGASEGLGSGGTEGPAIPAGYQDCLGVCLAAHAAAPPPEQAAFRAASAITTRLFIPCDAPMLERSGMRAFLARAPPALA